MLHNGRFDGKQSGSRLSPNLNINIHANCLFLLLRAHWGGGGRLNQTKNTIQYKSQLDKVITHTHHTSWMKDVSIHSQSIIYHRLVSWAGLVLHKFESALDFVFNLLDHQAHYLLCVRHHMCRTPLHEECPQHHGHKRDPEVKLGTCGAIGERVQVILL
jgi:hypothetical protein